MKPKNDNEFRQQSSDDDFDDEDGVFLCDGMRQYHIRKFKEEFSKP